MTTDALIIRENNNIGEADRFVTALTRDFGVVRASARGARNLKSRSASATQLLAYSRLSLIRGREKYIVEDAQPQHVFFGLRKDIGRLSLAQYFCELAGVLAPQEESAGGYLRLMLNALHFLESGRRDIRQIKAVVELRLLSLSGFMPDLTACQSCGCFESETMTLLPNEGVLVCGGCGAGKTSGLLLPPGVLSAMRHIVFSSLEKCFSFTLPDDSMALLERQNEAFLLAQLGRSFHTLEFYHTVC